MPHTGSESGFFSFKSEDIGSKGSGGQGRSMSPDGASRGLSHAASWVAVLKSLVSVLQHELGLNSRLQCWCVPGLLSPFTVF